MIGLMLRSGVSWAMTRDRLRQPKGLTAMPMQPSRRRFLCQGAGALGVLALAGRPGSAGGPDAPTAQEMTRKAVEFLRMRQEPNGGWSTDRKEPGITALVITALLR